MDKEKTALLKSFLLIIPLCFIFVFFIHSFTKEIRFDLTQEFIDIEEQEKIWNYEENPYEYILKKFQKDRLRL